MLFQENAHPIPRSQHTTITVNFPCKFHSFVYELWSSKTYSTIHSFSRSLNEANKSVTSSFLGALPFSVVVGIADSILAVCLQPVCRDSPDELFKIENQYALYINIKQLKFIVERVEFIQYQREIQETGSENYRS